MRKGRSRHLMVSSQLLNVRRNPRGARSRRRSISRSEHSAPGPEYEVETILNSRYMEGGVEYLLKWKGYSPKANTWEPIENLRGCRRLVTEYHSQLEQSLPPAEPSARGNESLTVGQNVPEMRILRNGAHPRQCRLKTSFKVASPVPSATTEGDREPLACAGPANGASNSEGYGTEELNTDPEVELDELPGGSDGDADVEDAEGRLRESEILHRTSSKRRRRPKLVKQDTTESEDDSGRHSERPHRWNLRLSPQKESRPSAEESVSQIRPLVLGRVCTRGEALSCGEEEGPGLARWTQTLALWACHQHGISRLVVTSVVFVPLGLLLLLVCLLQRKEA
ncbi:chromobox protein homolog 8-like isoform X2 [Scyliorhinus canicula]|uniref:chromobox protein homolog 8-like isoform X2 n=1 Tax=Scyliorhinus canicula TaxID=7830 RepID=UPI0018F3B1FE|nr:chromobox protein homolog 8-like isoform X2 [Scyliorhinus canicula]